MTDSPEFVDGQILATKESGAPRLGPVATLSDHVSASHPAGPLSAELRRALLASTFLQGGLPVASISAMFGSFLGSARRGHTSLDYALWLLGLVVAIWVLHFLVFKLGLLLALRQDFAAGEVQSADGTVTLDRDSLIVTYPGAARWYLKHVGVPPGRYRFYFLPRSKYYLAYQPILSDEVSAPHPSTAAAGDTVTRLGQIIHFAEADLSENRAGRRSAAQTARARRKVMWLVLAALVVVPLTAWLFGSGPGPKWPVWVLGGWFLLVSLWYLRLPLLELWRSDVQSLEAPVVTLLNPSFFSLQFRLGVAGRLFDLPSGAVSRITIGQTYRVYVAPLTHQILSLERLEAIQGESNHGL